MAGLEELPRVVVQHLGLPGRPAYSYSAMLEAKVVNLVAAQC